jgi:hypothetical protein
MTWQRKAAQAFTGKTSLLHAGRRFYMLLVFLFPAVVHGKASQFSGFN